MNAAFFVIPVVDIASASEELNTFLAQNRVLSLKEHFVEDGPNSYWAVSVSYLPAKTSGKIETTEKKKKPNVDYKEVLSAEEFAIYAELRELRNILAKDAQVPPYTIFNNEQLAALVTSRVRTKAAMLADERVAVKAGWPLFYED